MGMEIRYLRLENNCSVESCFMSLKMLKVHKFHWYDNILQCNECNRNRLLQNTCLAEVVCNSSGHFCKFLHGWGILVTIKKVSKEEDSPRDLTECGMSCLMWQALPLSTGGNNSFLLPHESARRGTSKGEVFWTVYISFLFSLKTGSFQGLSS